MRFNAPYFPFVPRRPAVGHYGNYYPVSHNLPKTRNVASQSGEYRKLNLVAPKKSGDFSYAIEKEPCKVPNNSNNFFKFGNMSNNSKMPFLDIMGIQLEFDDFLILGLLLFLFMEGVDDQMLYIILFLLLLS